AELWRLHARLAIARGEPSRAIALLGRALKQAERAHESRAIGLTHYELGLCYRQVGDTAIVREHIAQAASALHAAGDQRNLALVLRSPMQFMRETTGAVFDTLAQIHLIRGDYEEASRCLQRSREAYGDASRWYHWSVRALEARVALRRGDAPQALATASEIAK